MRGRDAKKRRQCSSKSWKPRSCPSVVVRRPWRVARDRSLRAWRAAQTSLCAVFAARSIAPCVARSLFLIAQTSLCAVFAASSAKTRQNLAVCGLCGLSRLRPSFRIVLADVCGPESRQTSLRAVFAKIVFSPTRNAKSNTKNRHLWNDMLYFIIIKKHELSPTRNATLTNFALFLICFTPISFSTFAFLKKQSCKRRCTRCLPRLRLEIGVPTLVSYRAGRRLTRPEVRLES